MTLPMAISATTRWGILLVGLATGIAWSALVSLSYSVPPLQYVLVLVTGFAAVLMLSSTDFRRSRQWMLALAIVPPLALINGWLRWNFPEQPQAEEYWPVLPIGAVLVFLLLPFIQSLQEQAALRANAVLAALWRNTFTLLATLILVGVCWLILWFWGKLFTLVEVKFFYRLFFNNAVFPPIATALMFASGIALCRSLPGASAVFRRLVTLLVAAILPLHALVSVLFLSMLPVTGLAIIPTAVSAAALLNTMALMMVGMAAIVSDAEPGAVRYPRIIQWCVQLALVLAPLIAALACYALWLRVTQYGWTTDRVEAAVLAGITLLWTLAMAWQQRRNGAATTVISAGVLALMALCWLVLHAPILDPLRMTVNSQMARYQAGEAVAEWGDVYLLSKAGRRGKDALLLLDKHPEWQSAAVQKRGALASLVSNTSLRLSPEEERARLATHIVVRKGSVAPPVNWWYTPGKSVAYPISECLQVVEPCQSWMMSLREDGTQQVLLFNPASRQLSVFSAGPEGWQQSGEGQLPEDLPALEQADIRSRVKPWRDVEIQGQRIEMHYFDNRMPAP